MFPLELHVEIARDVFGVLLVTWSIWGLLVIAVSWLDSFCCMLYAHFAVSANYGAVDRACVADRKWPSSPVMLDRTVLANYKH